MNVLGTIFSVLLEVLKSVLPLVLEYIKYRENDSLFLARKRALELQNQAAQQARLTKECNADELSRFEVFQLSILDQLFKYREFRLRKTLPPS